MNPFRRATILLIFAALASGGVFVACGPSQRDSTPMGSVNSKNQAPPQEKSATICNNPIDMSATATTAAAAIPGINSSGSPDDRDLKNQTTAPAATTPAADMNSSGSPDDRDFSQVKNASGSPDDRDAVDLNSNPSKDGALKGKFKLTQVKIYTFNEKNFGSFILSADASNGFKGNVDCNNMPASGTEGLKTVTNATFTTDYDADAQTFGSVGKTISIATTPTTPTSTINSVASDTLATLQGKLPTQAATDASGKTQTTYLMIPLQDNQFELRTKVEYGVHGSRVAIYTSAIYQSVAAATAAPDATTNTTANQPAQ